MFLSILITLRREVNPIVVSPNANMVHSRYPPDVVDVLHHVIHSGHLLLSAVEVDFGI